MQASKHSAPCKQTLCAMQAACGMSSNVHRLTLGADSFGRARAGKQTDRKTLLGELNWIFTAITDTIAWNMLPRSLFQKLFRQDLLVASLFRNFMLAERIMLSCGCLPVSYPRLIPMHQHPMWECWDMTAECSLLQLPTVINDETRFKPSSFFSEQLTAFELWLSHGSTCRDPPEQLPVVLQVRCGLPVGIVHLCTHSSKVTAASIEIGFTCRRQPASP